MAGEILRAPGADPRIWHPVDVELIRQWLVSGESAWLPVIGTSMRPFLRAGSKVRISAPATIALGAGSLVVYETDERIVCHRVLRRRAGPPEARAILTKGDHWRTPHTWVAQSAVLGTVTAVERHGAQLDLQRPARRLQALALAGLSWVIIGALSWWRRGRQLLGGPPPCAPAA